MLQTVMRFYWFRFDTRVVNQFQIFLNRFCCIIVGMMLPRMDARCAVFTRLAICAMFARFAGAAVITARAAPWPPSPEPPPSLDMAVSHE